MARHEMVLQKVLRGTSDANAGFAELYDSLRRLGFVERQPGRSGAAATGASAGRGWLRS